MKRKSFFWLALMFLSMLSTSVFAQFAGGSGTQDDPWQVTTAEHLNNVRYYLGVAHEDKYFIQTANIDLGVPPWNEGEGWEPIGGVNYLKNFHGNYNGNGHVISGLYINRPIGSFQGLFGRLEGTIQNLGLADVDVTSHHFVGGLAGSANWGTLYNCSVTGNVTGTSSTGGLAGSGGSISNCHSAANVSGQTLAGGLVGDDYWGTISNCHSSGEVNGNVTIGGLLGLAYSCTISNCHSSGEVNGNVAIGGLVGSGGIIYDSHSTANVSGAQRVGGLIGVNKYSITFCYSAGNVSGNIDVGGLVGSNEGTIWHSYSTGNVEGEERVGGLVGSSENVFMNCYSTGEVTGISQLGGLIGANSGPIKNCYSSGSVSGNSVVGGLVGVNLENTVQDCFSIGSVTGDSETGGLVGRFDSGFIVHSYWNLETSGQQASSGGEGRLTAQMLYPYGENTFLGWDWVYWGPDMDFTKNNGYPYLRVYYDEVGNEDLVAPIPKSSISAFPQPAFKAPRVSIKSESPGKLSYTIYNVRGQKLYSAEIYSYDKEQGFELPFEAWKQLSNGVYLLSLERENQRIATSRMVVVK